MKKNTMMRIASVLLVAVLLSTCTISGTFAKYVTTDSGSDTARVAKWGVTAEVSGNLFGKFYNSNAAETNKNSIVASSTNVASADASNVVAPGTKNDSGLTVKIAGTPEVAYTITATNNNVAASDIFLGAGTWGVMIKETGLNAASSVTGLYTLSAGTYSAASGTWTSGTDYYKLIDTVTLSDAYYPINWTVAATGNATAISTTKNLTTIAASMLTGIAAGTHNANDDSAASYTLTWEWPFSVNDGADTILGDLMTGTLANGTVVKQDSGASTYKAPAAADYCLNVAFGMAVTVEQVD